ncbi:MAG: TolB family protein [Candidatus Riflebacteria bacterium]|nr:TolB family protein [Candidatus Riflebacteria bacterium]
MKLAFAGASPLEVTSEVDYHGSLSHDGKVLVFSSNRPVSGKAGPFQCYVKDPVATAAAVRAFPWEGNIWTPEFTPDGRALVFSSDSQKPEHIFLYDRVTQQPRALTTGSSKNMMPALSPDGKFVAFVSDRRGSNDIWIIGLDGKNLIQITTGKEDDREPRWWPDGRSLVFTRILEKYRNSVIMRVPLDPQGPPQPLVEGGRNWLADPSPDGRYLAYVRSKDADGSGNVILVRRLDSGAEFAVSPTGAGECYRPIWTRDLAGLIFHGERNGKKNLYQARFSKAPID